ncbi:MAG: hypothetical protein QM820_35425 [Minicystis sp.]
MERTGTRWIVGMALGCAALAACTGPKGDKGDPGEGTPSISAVSPPNAFLARTLDVTISGSGTQWAQGTTVDFGDDITVEKVAIASRSAIVATITVGPKAALGARDVTVKDGTGLVTSYTGAFDIASPVKVSTRGSLSQGSVITVHARGLDFETPFDTTSTGDGFFTPLEFTNMSVDAPPGMTASVDNVADYAVDYTLLVDVTAPAATVDVNLVSGPSGDTLAFPFPGAFEVKERAPKKVVPGAPVTDMLANEGDSALFTYTPSSASLTIVDIAATATDGNASPAAYFLPKSGKFAEAFAAGTGTTQAFAATDPIFAIAVDQGGYAGYAIGLQVKETPAKGGAEKEPNNTQAAAETNGAVTLPYVLQGAKLGSGTDQDWIAVTVTAAEMGKQNLGADGRARPAHGHGGGDPRRSGQHDQRWPERRSGLPRRDHERPDHQAGDVLREDLRVGLLRSEAQRLRLRHPPAVTIASAESARLHEAGRLPVASLDALPIHRITPARAARGAARRARRRCARRARPCRGRAWRRGPWDRDRPGSP